MSAIYPRPCSCYCCIPRYAPFLSFLILCLCNQLLGLHLPTCVGMYLGIMWHASIMTMGRCQRFSTMGAYIGSSVGSYTHSTGPQAGVERKACFCYGTDQGAAAMYAEERVCCTSAGCEKHSIACIHQSFQAARALRHSVVTVCFVTWSKLQPPALLLQVLG